MTRNELQSLLCSIEDQMGKADEDISQLRDLLKIVIQLLKNVQEQLDTVVEIQECNKFLLKRFEGSDDDIKFWTAIAALFIFTMASCFLIRTI